MTRYLRQTEAQIRAHIDSLIEAEALQTDKIVFYPTSYVVELLAELGFVITQDYVRRRYKEIGVMNENGLWVKKLK